MCHWKYRYLMKSLTEDEKYYIIATNDQEKLQCSCPSWIFSKSKETFECKHIRYMKDVFFRQAQKIEDKQYNKLKVLGYMNGTKISCDVCAKGPRGMQCEHRFTSILYEESVDKPTVVCNNCCIDFEMKSQE